MYDTWNAHHKRSAGVHMQKTRMFTSIFVSGSFLAVQACHSTSLVSRDSAEPQRETGSPWEDTAPVVDSSEQPGDSADTGGQNRYHPDNYGETSEHGLEAKLNVQDCRTCHGEDLTGGKVDVSCDYCHSWWRNDCLFCHGAVLDSTGAPPEDMDDQDAPDLISFTAHHAHVTGESHASYDCGQCHLVPDQVLATGHIFDSTPAEAEVDMAAGLSALGSYDGAGTCTNLYCHGSGKEHDGTAIDGSGSTTCSSCHPDTSTSYAWSTMSGAHSAHLEAGLGCDQCHAEVVGEDLAIVSGDLHVDGSVTVTFSAGGIYMSGEYCYGYCHGQFHVFSW